MKPRLGVVLLFALALSLHASVGIGDSYQQVIDQKGPPSGKMQAGETIVLRYQDATIKLKAGRVVAIEPGKNQVTGGTTPVDVRTAPATLAAPKAKLSWTTDYRGALAQAKEQNRQVFLFFTGSDWCIWCKRLNAEILAQPEFARYAEDKLILVELDFPQGKFQPAALKAQNGTLARIFQIEGYPTVIVLNSAGKPVGRLGYQEGGPVPFVKALKKL
jgi:protein disulfide-isomerase